MSREPEIVWLSEERTYGILVQLGAYYSMVCYTRGGIDYHVQVPNDEIEYLEDYAIDYEEEWGKPDEHSDNG